VGGTPAYTARSAAITLTSAAGTQTTVVGEGGRYGFGNLTPGMTVTVEASARAYFPDLKTVALVQGTNTADLSIHYSGLADGSSAAAAR
jgi:hypothetical protein